MLRTSVEAVVGFTLLVLLATVVSTASAVKLNKEAMCSTCLEIIELVEDGIESTTEKHDYQIRFRLDEKQRVPYARSEYRIMEILEGVCNGMKHYGYVDGPDDQKRVIRSEDLKNGGSFTGLSMGGKSGAEIAKICEYLLEEFIDDLTLLFHRDEKDIPRKFCVQQAQACTERALQAFEEAAELEASLFADAIPINSPTPITSADSVSAAGVTAAATHPEL